MAQTKSQPARGLVRRISGPVTHQRWTPDPDLSVWIEHFWSVSWAMSAGGLRGRHPAPPLRSLGL